MSPGFARSANALVAGYSYLKSTSQKRPVVYGMPLAIGVEITNHCNLGCPECASGSGMMTRKRGFMDTELYRKVIRELHPYLFRITLNFQGEPLMHPGLPSFIISSGNIKTELSTNGHYLTEENSEKIIRSGLGKLVISLDGIDQETYSRYRINGSFDTVMEGLRNITEARRSCKSAMKIELQFLVNRYNEHQIGEVRKLARRYGTFLRLKSMQIIYPESIESWLPSEAKFRRYEFVSGAYRIKNLMPDSCARLWFNPVITWDGKVVPCCFDKNADHIMGDLYQESFRDIWYGTKYQLFRRELLSGRKAIEICSNCTSGMRGVSY